MLLLTLPSCGDAAGLTPSTSPQDKCCTRLAGEKWIIADAIDHLPVCHAGCWKRERDRLRGKGIERKGLPLCHRRCYNEAIWQLEHPESVEEVTPHMRSLYEHVIEKGRACHFRDHQNERRTVRRREEGWLAGS